MFVVQLIGSGADSVVDMPFHVAQSCIASGTARIATDAEIVAAGQSIPIQAPPLTGNDGVPAGYRIEPAENGGQDLFDSGGIRLNREPFPNAAAARSAALEAADINVTLAPASDALNPEVTSDQIARRAERTFTLQDYEGRLNEETGSYDVYDFGGVKLNEEPVPSVEAVRAFMEEHLRLAIEGGEAAGEEAEDAEIEVPADWADLHWTKRRALARKITGEELPSAAAADAAIEDYLRRQHGN